MSKLSENNTSRLASLDILRGFDLFLLVFFQPVFAALVRQLNLPFLNDILYQFDHEVWEGFRFWDLVMPLFLFMTGASMPFSLSKYVGMSGSYWPVYRRILRRVFAALVRQLNLPFLNDILYQFDHEVWEGFRFWDLVMPLFLFMTGASMPFSLSKYVGMSGSYWPVYRRILRRVFLLFIFGMIVQGNLLGLDSSHIYLYSNTLQSIAVGYLIAAVIQLHFSFRWQIGITLLLLFIYWIPMTFLGDFTPAGNFAEQVDRWVLGRFRDGVFWNEDGTWSFSPYYNYTWIWSSLTFGVTVMLGAFAGKIMKEGKANRKKVVQTLSVIGVLLVGLAMLWSLQMPIIKRLWTGSMTLLSGGYCFLLMALFYYWIDYKGHSRGLNWLKVYGMNSITAYLLGEVVNFRCIADSVSYGLKQYMGDYYPVWLTFANYLILFFLLRMMYKRGLFLKV